MTISICGVLQRQISPTGDGGAGGSDIVNAQYIRASVQGNQVQPLRLFQGGLWREPFRFVGHALAADAYEDLPTERTQLSEFFQQLKILSIALAESESRIEYPFVDAEVFSLILKVSEKGSDICSPLCRTAVHGDIGQPEFRYRREQFLVDAPC